MNYHILVGEGSLDDVEYLIRVFKQRFIRVNSAAQAIYKRDGDQILADTVFQIKRITNELMLRISTLEEIKSNKVDFARRHPGKISPYFFRGTPLSEKNEELMRQSVKRILEKYPDAEIGNARPDILEEVLVFKEYIKIKKQFDTGEIDEIDFQSKVLPLMEKINFEDLSK